MHGLAELGNAPRQGGFTDKRPRPARLKKFVLGDNPVAMLEQVEKHLKHFGLERYSLPRAMKFLAVLIERIAIKDIDHIRIFLTSRQCSRMITRVYCAFTVGYS
jgi:hypothetical protein